MSTYNTDTTNKDSTVTQPETSMDQSEQMSELAPVEPPKYTYSSDDIREGIASDTVHCLLPRPTRSAVEITTSYYVAPKLISNKVVKNFRRRYSKP